MRAETYWSLKQTCVFSGCRNTLQKGPHHRRKVCANSLWLYSYYTQSSPLKNKNIDYIFIYLRVLRCLSSGSIYNRTPNNSKPSQLGSRIRWLNLCRGVESLTECPVLTLNQLMARLQSWSFWECEESLHCYYSQSTLTRSGSTCYCPS